MHDKKTIVTTITVTPEERAQLERQRASAEAEEHRRRSQGKKNELETRLRQAVMELQLHELDEACVDEELEHDDLFAFIYSTIETIGWEDVRSAFARWSPRFPRLAVFLEKNQNRYAQNLQDVAKRNKDERDRQEHIVEERERGRVAMLDQRLHPLNCRCTICYSK